MEGISGKFWLGLQNDFDLEEQQKLLGNELKEITSIWRQVDDKTGEKANITPINLPDFVDKSGLETRSGGLITALYK